MKVSFKKRLVYFFSNKKAQEIESAGGGIYKMLVYILLGLILGFILFSIITKFKFTP